jgi:hypothetical protein
MWYERACTPANLFLEKIELLFGEEERLPFPNLMDTKRYTSATNSDFQRASRTSSRSSSSTSAASSAGLQIGLQVASVSLAVSVGAMRRR